MGQAVGCVPLRLLAIYRRGDGADLLPRSGGGLGGAHFTGSAGVSRHFWLSVLRLSH